MNPLAHNRNTPTRFFPEASPLARLTAPTYQGLLSAVAKYDVSFIFNTSKFDETRQGVRNCYSELHGPGAELVMPLSAVYITDPRRNSVYLPAEYHKRGSDGQEKIYPGIDLTAIGYLQSAGFLGKDSPIYVSDLVSLKQDLVRRNRQVYNIDDYGTGFDDVTANRQDQFVRCNSKEHVHTLTKYAPEQVILNVFEVTKEQYDAYSGRGEKVLYVKTCNTENASAGVWRVENQREFEALVEKIRTNTKAHNLSPLIVLQPEILGVNKSFQVFISLEQGADIQVVALTNQIIGPDKVSYAGNINLPITKERLEIIGPAIIDLVDGIKRHDPNTFGFVMCDYFELPDGRVTLFDPGLRPTGNTPSAMAKLWFEQYQPGREVTLTNFVYFSHPTGAGTTYDQVVKKLGSLADPEQILKTSFGVLPWGHNHIAGNSLFMFLTPTAEEVPAFREQVFSKLS